MLSKPTEECHGGASYANRVFVDGHAKWTRRSRFEQWARDPRSAITSRDPLLATCRQFISM